MKIKLKLLKSISKVKGKTKIDFYLPKQSKKIPAKILNSKDFIKFLLANHEPVHWTIKCNGWRDLASEVRQDQYLDEQSKLDLINYFKTKVEESCDFEP